MATSRRRRGRPMGITGVWGEIAERAGGVEELARILHVARSTVRRWSLGVEPSWLERYAIRTICRERGWPEPWSD